MKELQLTKITISEVRYENFVKLTDYIKKMKNIEYNSKERERYIGIRIRYNGNDINGNLTIESEFDKDNVLIDILEEYTKIVKEPKKE